MNDRKDPYISDDEPSIEPVVLWACVGGWMWLGFMALAGWL